MLTEEIIPMVRVKLFPNQQPWVDRTAAYNAVFTTSVMSAYKAISDGVRYVVRDAKCQYWEPVESYFHQGNTAYDMNCVLSWTTKPRTL